MVYYSASGVYCLFVFFCFFVFLFLLCPSCVCFGSIWLVFGLSLHTLSLPILSYVWMARLWCVCVHCIDYALCGVGFKEIRFVFSYFNLPKTDYLLHVVFGQDMYTSVSSRSPEDRVGCFECQP